MLWLGPLLGLVGLVTGNWEEWWTYDGISGPAYWGLINPAWIMCNKVSHHIHRGCIGLKSIIFLLILVFFELIVGIIRVLNPCCFYFFK